MYQRYLVMMAFLLMFYAGSAQSAGNAFKVIPLGIRGGVDEGNLSSYMLAVNGTDNYLCLDAGTLHDGLEKAVANGILKGEPAQILKQQVKGYFISHGHLDHIAGLVINSPEDSAKVIYGLPYCLDILKDKYFTWRNWANFTNEGDKPLLNKYHYQPLSSDSERAIENTAMFARAFTLSHSAPYQSSAILVRHDDDNLLYLGDTGADEIEKSDRLQQLWQQVAPLVKAKKLKAIFIEVSFPDEQPLNKLFGHLTPTLLMKELSALASVTGEAAIKNLPVVITHMKPSGNNEAMIKKQLVQLNKLQVNLVFPQQGKLLLF